MRQSGENRQSRWHTETPWRSPAVLVLRRMVWALLALWLPLAACVSPTLPLPPPEEPDTMSAVDDDATLWQISGTCTPGATVLIVNDVTGEGIAIEDREANGRYTAELPALACDTAWIQQIAADETSGQTYFVIEPKGPGAEAVDCSQPNP